MNLAEVAKELFEGIEPSFQLNNFKLKKRSREFKREDQNISQIVDFYFVKQASLIKIKPEIRIKVKEIEDIYRAITSKENRPFRTLGNHLFEIIRYVDNGEETGKKNVYDWSVESKQDLEKLIKVIPEYLEETILPYFEENSSLARVDYLLNKYPRELSVHNYLYPLRVNLAIIAAKLNNNSKYEDLISIYEEEMEEAAEDYKEEFFKLKVLLSARDQVVS